MAEQSKNKSPGKQLALQKLSPNALLRKYGSKQERDMLPLLINGDDLDIDKDISGSWDNTKIPGVNFQLLWWTGGVSHTVKVSTFLSAQPFTIYNDAMRSSLDKLQVQDSELPEFFALEPSREPLNSGSNSTEAPFSNIFKSPEFYLRYGLPIESLPGTAVASTIHNAVLGITDAVTFVSRFNKVAKFIDRDEDARSRYAQSRELRSQSRVSKQLPQSDADKGTQQAMQDRSIIGSTILSDAAMRSQFNQGTLDWRGRDTTQIVGINPDLQVLDRLTVSSSSVYSSPPLVQLILFQHVKNNTAISYIGHLTSVKLSEWKFNIQGVPVYAKLEFTLTVLDYITANNTVNFTFKYLKD